MEDGQVHHTDPTEVIQHPVQLLYRPLYLRVRLDRSCVYLLSYHIHIEDLIDLLSESLMLEYQTKQNRLIQCLQMKPILYVLRD